MQPLVGLIAAPHTPMHGDGRLRLEVVEQQVDRLVETGVAGAFVGGTTGESLSLTVDERIALTETWAGASRDRGLKLIAHVGGNCLPDAQRLAADAERHGVDAIAAFAPSFFRPSSAKQLVHFGAAIASHAPNTPFYFYDIPSMTSVRLPTVELLVHGATQIPTLAGIKYTNNDLVQLQNCLQYDRGRFDILFGCDEALLAGLSLGARGAVGSTYNFAAPLYHRVIRAFEAGDLAEAQRQQARAVQMVETIAAFGFISASKSVMAMIGIDCGPARSPLAPLSPGQENELRDRLEKIGYFQWGVRENSVLS